jgi:hypothetical protein
LKLATLSNARHLPFSPEHGSHVRSALAPSGAILEQKRQYGDFAAREKAR